MRTKTTSAVIICTFAASGALADIVPVSRDTSLTASWYQVDPPFPGSSGSASDGTTSFNYFSNSINSGAGYSSQTSYLLTNGAYANASGSGYQGTSIMHPSGASGFSTFTYIFDLTSPATLYIIGSLDRGSPFIGYGAIEIYNAANTRVYQALGSSEFFATSTAIADTYAAAAGQYRFVVRGGNSGAGGGAPGGQSAARAFLTLPSPGAASVLALGGLLACRRRRA